ncbi:ubiquitin-like domain-containing protein [Haematococcus lacustris]|uniref:Ubiquitin-like domain-containing protein n=1 Tax=Haematococcus lacustris TaxID=44745 RepID=A0A699ZQG4_HAELA|nr:ubiquitin-like domain-containing protein [Haematococcus lacustris]
MAGVDAEEPLAADEQIVAETAEQAAEPISFQAKQEVSQPCSTTVRELKQLIYESTKIRPEGQKLLNKGVPLKDDSLSLTAAGVKAGSKLMLIGTPEPLVAVTQAGASAAAAAQPGTGTGADWDSAPVEPERWCEQTVHAKVLAKGVPEDGIPGIKGRQVPLPPDLKMLGGLLNSQGTKVRLTFKDETGELWIGTATYTQRVPLGSITKIESQPIKDKEELSIVALQLGSGKLWLYFFPSQYVAGLKIRILGVSSLL